MRMAHVADVHLGHALMNLRSREEAVMETFERLMEEVRECSVDVLVIAGDLFEHARPKTEALYLAVEKLSELKEDGVEIVATAGNHEIAGGKGPFLLSPYWSGWDWSDTSTTRNGARRGTGTRPPSTAYA